MKLFFWQNCISPHQLPYIKELCNDDRISQVFLVAPVWDLSERKLMGWNNNDFVNDVEIIIAPDEKNIKKMLQDNQEKSIHFFSGIKADKFVYHCFKESLNYNVKRGLITEPPFIYRKPLFLHNVRFFIFDYKYRSKIDYVFGMGDSAVDYYKYWLKESKVFLFGYCVDFKLDKGIKKEKDHLRMVFVGNLIERKNVVLLLKAFNEISDKFLISLDIIGDGPEYIKLRNYVDRQNLDYYITFHGKRSMNEIHSVLPNYDILVLPSIHDGWGAVINEGLLCGLFIISSDSCGAKTLIENSNRGLVFKNKDVVSLTNALKYCLSHAEEIKNGKQDRVQWAEIINGRSMAKYMVDCMVTKDIVMPPWKI